MTNSQLRIALIVGTCALMACGSGNDSPTDDEPNATLDTAVSASDTAQYNFENSIQGWQSSGTVSGIRQSRHAYAGARSLAVTMSGAAGSGYAFVGLASPPPGATVDFHVWCPSGTSVTAIQPYVSEDATRNWRWTGNWQAMSSLSAGAWNTIRVTLPQDAATPLFRLGVEFESNGGSSTTCYVDNVGWPVGGSTATVDAGTTTAEAGTTTTADAGSTTTVEAGSTSTVDAGSTGTVDTTGTSGSPCTPAGSPSNAGAVSLLPADRATNWRPGVSYNGGIPCRTTISATLSPSGADDTQAINSALASAAANQTVLLKAGKYTISGTGLVVPGNVTLRGEVDSTGRPATLLVKQDGQPYSVITIGNRYSSNKYKTTVGTSLASDALKGSNTLTLTSNPGLSVGEIVYVDMATDPNLSWWNPARSPGGGPSADPSRGWFSNYDRPIEQVMEVQSVSGNTVTFTSPFHIAFTVANHAQLWQYSMPATKWAGVENLYTFGGGGGDGGGNIHFYSCAYCWAKNVEADYSNGTAINLDGTFRSEVRDSYSHTSADPNPGGGGYLMGMNRGAADNLFENNISWNGNKVIVMRATGGGNVISYNYMQDSYGAGYKTIPEIGLNSSHMTTPHYELFEGNESSNFDADSVWGGSIYITVFRNSLTGLRISAAPLQLTDQAGRHAMGNQQGHWWYTFSGNVLGTAGMVLNVGMPGGYTGQTSWVADATGAACGDSSVAKMWTVGWSDNGNWGAPQDTLVAQRTIRDGNFDFVTKAVNWANGAHALPDSLYLGSAPAFFGSNPWPWVDPLTGSTHTLPAKARWAAMVSAGTHRSPLDISKGI